MDAVCYDADFFGGHCAAEVKETEETKSDKKVSKEEPISKADKKELINEEKETSKDTTKDLTKETQSVIDKVMTGAAVGDFTSNHLKEQEDLSSSTLKCLLEKQQ